MAIISNNVAKWIDPNFSLLEVLVANSMWRSHLKNLWWILCESCPSSESFSNAEFESPEIAAIER